MTDSNDQQTILTTEFIILLAVTVLTFSIMYAPQPLLYTIQNAYPSHSDATIALLMTVILVPLGIAPLIYGFFLSSLDTKFVLQCCVALLCISCVIFYFAKSFYVLLGLRLVHGLVSPAVLTCIMAHISAKFQGTLLQNALAIYIATTISGGLLGRVVGGGVATLFGWKMVFLVLAGAFLLLFFALSKLKKRSENAFKPIKFTEFSQIFNTRGIKRILYIDGCGFFVFVALATYLPFFLNQISDTMTEWRVSLVYLGYGIGVAIALYSNKISILAGSRVRAIRLGIGIYLCAMCLFFIPNPIYTFLAMFMVCTGQFMEHSISPGLVNRMCDRDKCAVNGLYLSVYYMGGAMGSYFPGFIYAAWGWNVLIICLCAALVTVLIATWGLEKHTPVQ